MFGYSRYFIELSYNGEAYSGWQKQLNSNSIQETLEKVISNLFLYDKIRVLKPQMIKRKIEVLK